MKRPKPRHSMLGYLPTFGSLGGKCRQIHHTLSVWERNLTYQLFITQPFLFLGGLPILKSEIQLKLSNYLGWIRSLVREAAHFQFSK